MDQDPDPAGSRLRALAGIALAVLASVFIAALLARGLGDLFGDDYHTRVAIYGALLAYVVAGAVLLALRVAPRERSALTGRRVLRWLATLWLWPVLWWWR